MAFSSGTSWYIPCPCGRLLIRTLPIIIISCALAGLHMCALQFKLPGSLLYRRLRRLAPPPACTNAPACTSAPALFSVPIILARAYSPARARADALHEFPLDDAEENRRRMMGATPMAAVDRKSCARGTAEMLTGVKGDPAPEPLEADRSQLPFVRRGACRRYLLLVVVFNNDFYGNVPYLRALYGAAFARVVFYGEKGNASLGVRASPLIWGGYRQHVTVAQAMLENPGFDGYWWIGDDVLLNYPYLFATMDLERVWTTRREPNKGEVFPGKGQPFAANQDKWNHWNTWYGMQAVQKLYACLRPAYAARMPAAFNCSHCVVYMGSDAGYVPRRFADAFVELVFTFRTGMHEIALPTILRLMVPDVTEDLHEDFDSHLYVWSGDKFRTILKMWTPHMAFAHPVKFSASNPGSRRFALDKLSESMVVYGHQNGSYGPVDELTAAVSRAP